MHGHLTNWQFIKKSDFLSSTNWTLKLTQWSFKPFDEHHNQIKQTQTYKSAQIVSRQPLQRSHEKLQQQQRRIETKIAVRVQKLTKCNSTRWTSIVALFQKQTTISTKKTIFFLSRRIRQEMKRWCNSLPTNPRKLFFCQTSKNFEVVRFAGLEVCNWASRPPRNFRKKTGKIQQNKFETGSEAATSFPPDFDFV